MHKRSLDPKISTGHAFYFKFKWWPYIYAWKLGNNNSEQEFFTMPHHAIIQFELHKSEVNNTKLS